MAEVRQRFSRGAYDFAHKIYNRHLLESLNEHGKGATRSPSLSAGCLLGGIQNGDLSGAESAAVGVTVGVSTDGYTRVFGTGDAAPEHGNPAEYYYYYYYNGLNKDYSLSNNAKIQNIEKTARIYRSNAKFRRTLCASGSAPQPSLRTLFWGRGQVVFIRAYTGDGTRSEPLYRTKTGYYDILEVTPTATRAQIKTAYYKQSFSYHPDRNAGSDEATVRFSEISEAYTVLGNKALRKKYDRGLLSLSDLTATARPSAKDAAGGSGKQQTTSTTTSTTGGRRSVMGTDIREDVADFDAFFKTYYNEQLQRQQDIRVRKEEMLRRKQQRIEERKLGNLTEVGIGMMLAVALALLFSLNRR